MNILEMSWEDIGKALQPKDAFKDLTHEQAIKLCREYADYIYGLNSRIQALEKRNSELGWDREYYGKQVGDREQQLRSEQGIFG